MSSAPRALLGELYRAALARVDPAPCLARVLGQQDGQLLLADQRLASDESLVVLAAGKAAAPMARAVEAWAGERIRGGLVVTKDGHAQGLARLPLLHAGHPLPDARSERAARAVLDCVARLGARDRLLVLLSGGASALLSAPLPGLGAEDLRVTTRLLLEGGASIDQLNAVRKHLAALAGGRLARAARGRPVDLLVISDVPGDDPAVIASGPCSADPSRFADALAVLEALDLLEAVPSRVRAHLEGGVAGEQSETLKPGDASLARVRTHILARNADALEAARQAAEARGLPVRCLRAQLAGEARRAGRRLAGLALAARAPLLLIAGGETTVHVSGGGRGGRNQELALAAALALEGHDRITLLAAASDGEDGPTPAAGAFADGGTVARGRARGRDAEADLDANDSYGFFQEEGGLFVTGPSGTNVMDLVLAHIAAEPD